MTPSPVPFGVKDFLLKGAVGAACTAVLTLVGAVINANREDAVQNQTLHQMEQRAAASDQTLRSLDANVQQLDIDVAVLSERLKESIPPAKPKK